MYGTPDRNYFEPFISGPTPQVASLVARMYVDFVMQSEYECLALILFKLAPNHTMFG